MPFKELTDRKAYMKAYYAAHREHLIEKANKWNDAHPEQRRVSQAKWHQAYVAKHRDRINARQRAYDAAHPEKVKADNRTQRLRRYGLTHAQYEAMLTAQDRRCSCCHQVESHRGRNGEVTRLAVDHDHVTGSIRALLCHSCNTGIGLFLDDPAKLREAADYLDSFRSRQR